MENSETGPTIFLKLAQIEVQGYSGALSDLEENLLSSFVDFWPPGAEWHCLSGPPRGAAGDARKEKHCL